MGEKGNVAAEVASASMVERAGDAVSGIGGTAATKAVELGVEGAVAGVRSRNPKDDDAEKSTADGPGDDGDGVTKKS